MAGSGQGLRNSRVRVPMPIFIRRMKCIGSRSAAGIGISDPKLKKVPGNALRNSDVTAAVTGMKAVIQVLGVGLGCAWH
jgi:hypothetical protein